MTAENTERWTYIGRRRAATRKGVVNVYFTEDGIRTAWDDKHKVVGGIYEVPNVERNEDGPVKAGVHRSRYVGRVEDDSQVAAWTVEDLAAYNADELRKQEDRARKDRSALEGMTLAEFRGQFSRLPHGQRAAMQAWMTAYLWSGR